MANVRELDPAASPLDYYGSELRRYRESAGLRQSELGARIYCTGSLIGQVETARKVPSRQFSERADIALSTGGALTRLVGLVLRSQLPAWFRPYADLEARATYVSMYQAQVVPGLLQTKEYARALLAASVPDNLEELVAARLDRQQVLVRPEPPPVWTILDESVLYRPVGGVTVMRRQLEHLLDFQGSRRLHIQILPFAAGQHPGLSGSFSMLRFGGDPDIVYTEDFLSGHMTADPDAVSEGWLSYDRLQAAALSIQDSAALVSRVLRDHYGPTPETPPRPAPALVPALAPGA